MDLDSDILLDSPPEDISPKLPATSMEVIPGDSAARALSHAEQSRADVVRYRKSYKTRPDSAEVCNLLAWTYVMAPPDVRDTNEMLAVAQKAVQLEPQSALNQNTLGAAYCRAGRFKEAIATLEKNARNSADTYLPFDLYFLAMSWHGLKDTAKARVYYDWAERWTRMQQDVASDVVDQLQQLRAEAAGLLGIEGSSTKDRSVPR